MNWRDFFEVFGGVLLGGFFGFVWGYGSKALHDWVWEPQNPAQGGAVVPSAHERVVSEADCSTPHEALPSVGGSNE